MQRHGRRRWCKRTRADARAAALDTDERASAAADRAGLWAQAIGGGGHIDSDGNGPESRYRSEGVVVGLDHAPSFSTQRSASLTQQSAESSHRGDEWALSAQVEYAIGQASAGEWQIRPLAGLRHARISEDGFTETGAGISNLQVAARDASGTQLQAGLKWVRGFESGRGTLELLAMASLLAGDNDRPVTASPAGQAGSFRAAGTPLRRNALTLGASASGQLTSSVSLYAMRWPSTAGMGRTRTRSSRGCASAGRPLIGSSPFAARVLGPWHRMPQ